MKTVRKTARLTAGVIAGVVGMIVVLTAASAMAERELARDDYARLRYRASEAS